MFRPRLRNAHQPAARVAAQASPGVACYRTAPISREQLWALVENPSTSASTRTAAAEALAETLDVGDRARLRAAASHCPDPRVRVAIGQLARDDSTPQSDASRLRRR
jgi:hypothetical protein